MYKCHINGIYYASPPSCLLRSISKSSPPALPLSISPPWSISCQSWLGAYIGESPPVSCSFFFFFFLFVALPLAALDGVGQFSEENRLDISTWSPSTCLKEHYGKTKCIKINVTNKEEIAISKISHQYPHLFSNRCPYPQTGNNISGW